MYRIDCAGILKLRNADIELRNGETNIGRKNTRVRLVYRVHIPEPAGHVVSLQVASQPIECCTSSCLTGQPPTTLTPQVNPTNKHNYEFLRNQYCQVLFSILKCAFL